MNQSILTILLACLSLSLMVDKSDFSQWRGPNRDGVYPESNLLDRWPAAGPTLIWKYEGLGAGFSSAAVTSNRVYSTGMTDSITSLFCFDLKGRLQWKNRLGPDYTGEYSGTYSTSLIYNGLGYTVNSLGVLYCFNTSDGKIAWTKNLVRVFDGNKSRDGFLDNLIVDGNTIFCGPGGYNRNIVALDRLTGELIWESRGEHSVVGFGSPILADMKNRKLYIYQDSNSIRALDTRDGRLAWKFIRRADTSPGTPVYRNGCILTIDEQGTVMIRMNEKGTEVQEVWRNPDFFPLQGDAVVIGDRIYGKGRVKKFCCVDWNTGKELYSMPFKSMIATVISADGMIYCYDFEGNIYLIKPLEDHFETVGTFHINGGKKEHCSHPVIRDGVLYVRHDSSLFAFNLRGS
jgi:outer membrane protein assembly factor BamB